jgi:hypothetical protein
MTANQTEALWELDDAIGDHYRPMKNVFYSNLPMGIPQPFNCPMGNVRSCPHPHQSKYCCAKV